MAETPTAAKQAPAVPAVAHSPQVSSPLSVERFRLIIAGFAGLEIHNDTRATADEITLLPLFSALNACREFVGDTEVEQAYDTIYNTAKLTLNASRYWEVARMRNADKISATGYGVLVKYLKTYAPDYYNDKLKTKRAFTDSTYTV